MDISLIGENVDLTNNSIALYGLGTETERLISQWGSGPKIVGLLDGFKESGEAFGYPIISLQQAIDLKVERIIVVARPGSCKVIAKRIKDDCIANGVEVYDVRGNNLLEEKQASYEFSNITTYTKDNLLKKIDESDVISFDFFDTLINRKISDYTDIFDLVANQVGVKELSHIRIAAEKELSRNSSPTLLDIYTWVKEKLTGIKESAEELASIEFQIDSKMVVPRDDMTTIISYAKKSGKKVILTSDTYYSKAQMEELLAKCGLDIFDELFISCEYGTFKTQKLFSHVIEANREKKIHHIGNDEFADIEKAKECGIDTFHIYGNNSIMDALGGMGFELIAETYSDRAKLGLFLSKKFSSPFQFENGANIEINDCFDIGYYICGPMIVDFMQWIIAKKQELDLDGILLCARDGYLLEKIYNRFCEDKDGFYFLTSRISSIRAGIMDEDDINYVDSMKFFGTEKESMLVRFGIDEDVAAEDRNALILEKAKDKRRNYLKYIDSLYLPDGKLGVFDFVAKGTTQLFLQKFMSQQLKGLYFLQLEPEFMADKGVDIESFYTEKERDTSAIFDNYYILETILTSPMPSVDEFDEGGQPVYAKETRSDENLECVSRMQQGIMQYVDDYLEIVPVSMRQQNKMLDEAFLTLIGKLEITDPSFENLVVEDPFFGRMTNIVDVM